MGVSSVSRGIFKAWTFLLGLGRNWLVALRHLYPLHRGGVRGWLWVSARSQRLSFFLYAK